MTSLLDPVLLIYLAVPVGAAPQVRAQVMESLRARFPAAEIVEPSCPSGDRGPGERSGLEADLLVAVCDAQGFLSFEVYGAVAEAGTVGLRVEIFHPCGRFLPLQAVQLQILSHGTRRRFALASLRLDTEAIG